MDHGEAFVAPTVIGTVGRDGWYTSAVTVTWTVLDDQSAITMRNGCETTALSTDTMGIALTCAAASDGGSSSSTVTIKIDSTPPTISCGVAPDLLSAPNHRLVSVATSVNVADLHSGSGGFTLVYVTSNEPDAGIDRHDVANDMQDWTLGTADINGRLRAERSGTGSGRVYTLSYRGVDVAGNAAICNVAAFVPHDQGK